MFKNSFLMAFLCAMLVSSFSSAMDTEQDKPIKFKIVAEPNIKHQDIWFGFMAKDNNKISHITSVFPAKHVKDNLFKGGMDTLPIQGEIIYVAIYVGGGNMYMAEYPLSGNKSTLREIVINWDPEKKQELVAILNCEIQLAFEDGSKKTSKVFPVMLVEGLGYSNAPGGKAMDLFTKAIFQERQEFDFNFGY